MFPTNHLFSLKTVLASRSALPSLISGDLEIYVDEEDGKDVLISRSCLGAASVPRQTISFP